VLHKKTKNVTTRVCFFELKMRKNAHGLVLDATRGAYSPLQTVADLRSGASWPFRVNGNGTRFGSLAMGLCLCSCRFYRQLAV